jgi:uncharacterized membrane protein
MRTHFQRDTSGAIAVIFALLTPIFMMCAAIAVDVSTFFLQKRALQGATDLAALAAAQNPGSAWAAAQANLTLNGFTKAAVQTVQLGTYTANAAVSVGQRFVPGASGNAVQVTTQIQAPYYFANIFNMLSGGNTGVCAKPPCAATPSSTANSATITATATAAASPQAAFAIASGLANLNGGIINSIFGKLLGANVSLSLMDYQSLANANVDLFAFSNALATHANLTAVTYNQLATMQFQESDVLAALASAAGSSNGVTASVVDLLNSLSSLAPTTKISIGSLLSFGQYGALLVNSPEPLTVSADALDMVSGIAQLANGTNQVAVALNVNAPPIASATLALSIGERPVGTSFVTIGSTGATVHTAQTRLLLTLQIAQTGSTSLISLPIYLEIASGTATLQSASCGLAAGQSSATLSVTPAVVNAWIGTVSSANMSNFSSEPTPSAATLLTLPGIATVSGSANAAITNLSAISVAFGASDILNDTQKTTSTTDYVASLLYNLFANLKTNVTLLGLNLSLPNNLGATVGATLAAATTPIDQTISQVLNTLGLSVGNAYTWVSGVQCSTKLAGLLSSQLIPTNSRAKSRSRAAR